MTFPDLAKMAKSWDEFRALPAKVSQLIVKRACLNLVALIRANNDWIKQPDKYKWKPKLPTYKNKETGRFPLYYNDQAISQAKLKLGLIVPSPLGIEVKTKQSQNQVLEVRVVPKIHGHYVVEVVYDVDYDEVNDALDTDLIASIDLGVNNLATVASNKNGFQRSVYSGKRVKRGLFVSGGGLEVNADLNGAYNIMVKAYKAHPDYDPFEGVHAIATHPVLLTPQR